MTDKIKVAVSGVHYPMSIMRYFISALQSRDDVDLFTCGPFTGNSIPWAGGMNIYSKHIHTPDLPFSQDTKNQSPSSIILRNKLPWKPDLFIMVDAGWHFRDRPDAKYVVLVETDPHVLKPHYDTIVNIVDKIYCMQKIYSRSTDEYLPYCACKEFHYPENLEKEHDVCLIGLHYENRTQLLHRLRSRGLNVYYSIGNVFDDYRHIYNKSRIALSWSSLEDLIARVFEGMLMKIPVVCNRVPDLPLHFDEGTHYLGFDTILEAENQVLEALSAYDSSMRMATQAHEVVKENHLYDHRIEQILKDFDLI